MQLELPFLVEAPPPAALGRLRYIALAGRMIAYRFRRARRRTIGLAIDEYGLAAAAPRWAAIADVEAFIREKERWIVRRLDELRRHAPAPFAWQAGAALPYLGGTLALEPTAGVAIELAADRLRVPASHFDAASRLRAAVVAWLKSTALAFHRARIELYADTMDVPVPEVGLSNAASQWGSCTKARDGRGRVRLHWRLLHFEPRLIDYVVVHELAHLKHMNHSAAFWRVVAAAYPGHEQARRELRERSLLVPAL